MREIFCPLVCTSSISVNNNQITAWQCFRKTSHQMKLSNCLKYQEVVKFLTTYQAVP